MRGMKETMVPLVIRPLEAVTPKLKTWPQEKLGTTFEFPIQKSAMLRTTKILRRTLKLPENLIYMLHFQLFNMCY